MKSVVAVVGDRVAGFELGILCQVFGLDRSDDGLPCYDFTICGPRPGLVPTTSGFAVEVPSGLDHVASADLVAIPAWPDLDAPLDPVIGAAIRDAYEAGATLLAICSGAFALAGAGVLDGRRATTHWQFTSLLRKSFPSVDVVEDVLYVSDGPVLTSAGAAAGIDACMHLVRTVHGSEVANSLARRMVVPAHREGGQAQYVEMPVPACPSGFSQVLDWAAEHLDEPLTVDVLARRAGMSGRSFARHFKATTGVTPHRWLLEQRLRRAELLLETTELTVDVVAHRSGFAHPDTLRHHFARRRGTSPSAHRRAFTR